MTDQRYDPDPFGAFARAREALERRGRTYSHASARYLLLSGILHKARRGELQREWRMHLPNSADIAVDELSGMPIQPWEPYAAAGDWRRALDAWYAAALNLEAEREAERWRWQATEPDLPGTDGHPVPLALDVVERDRQANDRWWNTQQDTRDILTASYLAGLAGGGDHINWVDWYVHRKQRATHGGTSGWTAWMEQLPDYWTNQLTEVPQ
ncbi:hypothetical protein [Mycolicibacterium fortuitum]|uniref:hypothetical protein n=1 Tax=Mycolicibacterium fortuitum TaxID=1766 RepID=UPI003AB05037